MGFKPIAMSNLAAWDYKAALSMDIALRPRKYRPGAPCNDIAGGMRYIK